MKTRSVDRSRARIYWEKAKRFRRAADGAAETKAWDAAVSAAVHAGINAVDALCVQFLSRRAAASRHEDAVLAIQRLSNVADAERLRLAKHLAALLMVKNLAEYEDRLCEEDDARQSIAHAQRLLEGVARALADHVAQRSRSGGAPPHP